MLNWYRLVIETDISGEASAYVAGLPVFAAAPTRQQAVGRVRETLERYLARQRADRAPQHLTVVGFGVFLAVLAW